MVQVIVTELLVMLVAVTDEINGGGCCGPELDVGVSAISDPHHGEGEAILPETVVRDPEAGAFVAAPMPFEKI